MTHSCSVNGTFSPMDHPKTSHCGIFINFEKESFEEFVRNKYHECFPLEPSNLSSNNAKEDDKTWAERIVFGGLEDILKNRNSIFQWIYKTYVIGSTTQYWMTAEHYIATMCSKLKNEHLYCYSLAQLCFELNILKIYKQQDDETDRSKRHKQKQILYLIQKRDHYVKSLYDHLITRKYTLFDHTKYINTSNQDQSHLFNHITIDQEFRTKIRAYVSREAWCGANVSVYDVAKKHGVMKTCLDVAKKQEINVYDILNQDINLYIYLMSNVLVLMRLFDAFRHNNNQNNITAIMNIILKRGHCIRDITNDITQTMHTDKKRTRSPEDCIDIDELYTPSLKKNKTKHVQKNTTRRHLEPKTRKYVQDMILRMPNVSSNAYNHVVVKSAVPLCRIKTMRHNMLKNKRFKHKFTHINRQSPRLETKAMKYADHSLYLFIKNKSRSIVWNTY
eukprot:739700_1